MSDKARDFLISTGKPTALQWQVVHLTPAKCQLAQVLSTLRSASRWATRNQARHTLGILCDPTHPVFAHFPPRDTATGSGGNWSTAWQMRYSLAQYLAG